MQAFDILFETDVAGEALPRLVGLLPDCETVVVARRPAGGNVASRELAFPLCRGVSLAELVLAGDQRAKTEPGLARVLASTVVLLSRVARQAGALQDMPAPETAGPEKTGPEKTGDDGHADDFGDRGEAAGDEHPDD